MTSILPPFPRFVMTVFEPISTFAGFTIPFIATEYFAAEQIPGSAVVSISDNTRMLVLQYARFLIYLLLHLILGLEIWSQGNIRSRLGNIYLLLAMVSIAVLYTTTEPKVVRNYVIALWLADIGHIATTGYVMGYDKFIDFANYNPTTWGNVGVTAFLCATRTAYLLGLFGQDLQSPSLAKKAQ